MAALATLCFAEPQKRKPAPPSVEIVEILAHRSEKTLTIDGRVRNSGGQPIQGLQLVLDFLSSDGRVVTRQRGTLDSPWLDPGEQAEFQWQMRDHPRAVSFVVRAVDRAQTELPVRNAGPHWIE